MRHAGRCAAMAAVLMMAGEAGAGLVIDQGNPAGSSEAFGSGASPTLGQSFTPTLGGIDFASFRIYVDAPAAYRADVYSGIGLSGPLLGSSAALSPRVVAVPGTGGPAEVDFAFASRISLTPGSAYTLGLVRVSGANTLLESLASGDAYPGGTAIFAGGVAQSTLDLAFSEGISTAAVPEPSSLALALMGGLIGIGRARWRRGA